MTPRGLAALAFHGAKQLKQAILDGSAPLPAYSFKHGGLDADRPPKQQERTQG